MQVASGTRRLISVVLLPAPRTFCQFGFESASADVASDISSGTGPILRSMD